MIMLILITYDVNTETAAGRKRLKKVAKCCESYGRRVQNSVFECSLNEAQLVTVQGQLKELIDMDSDSLRFYNLGNHFHGKIIHLGIKKLEAPDYTLIL